MVVIRLARGGSKKAPFYRVVVANKQSPRDGAFLERVGFYNPVARGQEKALELDLVRIQYWIERGAQPSQTARSLMKRARKEQVAVVGAAE